jgi:hypothetical protein
MKIKNKKGDLLGNIIIVMISLIVFFALFPAVNEIIQAVLGGLTGLSDTVMFLINSVFFVMILGLLKWIYNSVSEV